MVSMDFLSDTGPLHVQDTRYEILLIFPEGRVNASPLMVCMKMILSVKHRNASPRKLIIRAMNSDPTYFTEHLDCFPFFFEMGPRERLHQMANLKVWSKHFSEAFYVCSTISYSRFPSVELVSVRRTCESQG